MIELDSAELPHFLSGACLEVHRELGPGLSTAVYRDCLARELRMRELFFEMNEPLLVHFRGISVESDDDVLDFIVESSVVLLVRSAEPGTLDSERGRLKSYLRHSGYEAGMLVNFNVRDLRAGIYRVASQNRRTGSARDLVLPS